MNLTHRPVVAGAILATAGLFLTGCSQDDGPASTEIKLGPISQRQADMQERVDAAMVSKTNRAEEAVAACMKELGFDYTPRVASAKSNDGGSDLDGQSKEFVELYGYAITTSDEIPGTSDSSTSYNQSMLESDEYQKALWGEVPEEDAESDWETWQPGGCYGEAEAAVFGIDESADSPVAQDLANLQVKVADDDRVVSAEDEWATCMGGKGYNYANPDAAIAAIYSRYYTSEGAIQGDELKNLRTEEISTAVADLECRDSSGLTKARADALAELEEAYYSENKNEVDAYFDQRETYLGRNGG